jgi:hypothetical protein
MMIRVVWALPHGDAVGNARRQWMRVVRARGQRLTDEGLDRVVLDL